MRAGVPAPFPRFVRSRAGYQFGRRTPRSRLRKCVLLCFSCPRPKEPFASRYQMRVMERHSPNVTQPSDGKAMSDERSSEDHRARAGCHRRLRRWVLVSAARFLIRGDFARATDLPGARHLAAIFEKGVLQLFWCKFCRNRRSRTIRLMGPSLRPGRWSARAADDCLRWLRTAWIETAPVSCSS
jgi:hypothetical protein